MREGARVIAFVTDAFGSGGGIAGYNRDFIRAAAADARIDRIDVLPRLQPEEIVGVPATARQHSPIYNRCLYSISAIIFALRSRPDVVFCGHLFMGPLAMLVAKLVGAKLMVQLHGIEIWSRPTRLQQLALEAADIVLCVSRDTRAHVLTWAGMAPERVMVMPNTVPEVYSPGSGEAVRARLGVGDKTVLLSVSRLDAVESYKGQDRVMSLIPALRARGHDVVFLIAGAGDDQVRLAAYAREHGIAEHVRFLGNVPADQMADLYRAADLYLMPSAGEGFGIVFLEAMASGTPALGLAIGGATDALGRGLGEAVDEGDLLESISRVLHTARPDPEYLASEVRSRYGRAVFQTLVAGVITRLSELRASPARNSAIAA